MLNDFRERKLPGCAVPRWGIMVLKLHCRQFVKLVNTEAEAKRAFSASVSSHNGVQDVDTVDMDDGAPVQATLACGCTVRMEYKEAAKRPEVHVLLERTWSIIAYHLPGRDWRRCRPMGRTGFSGCPCRRSEPGYLRCVAM